jgi:predicted metal-dependent phosphoesterase TrpH
LIDLHLHSTESDGTLRPAEVVRRAKAAGLTAIALTDHDTTAGVSEAQAEGAALGIEVVPGVEVSISHRPGTFHLIGLFVDREEPGLCDVLHRVREGRRQRNDAIYTKLEQLRLPLDRDEVEAHAGGEVVARPHFAQAMVDRGYVRTVKAAFDLWIGKGRPGYVERFRLTAPEAIAAIHGAGGVTVLCHPHTLGIEYGLPAFVAGLAEAGLDAIETRYKEVDPEREARLQSIARECSLLESGGSDFHGHTLADRRVGIGEAGLDLPESLLEALRERSK